MNAWQCWDLIHDIPLDLAWCFWLPGALERIMDPELWMRM